MTEEILTVSIALDGGKGVSLSLNLETKQIRLSGKQRRPTMAEPFLKATYQKLENLGLSLVLPTTTVRLPGIRRVPMKGEYGNSQP